MPFGSPRKGSLTPAERPISVLQDGKLSQNAGIALMKVIGKGSLAIIREALLTLDVTSLAPPNPSADPAADRAARMERLQLLLKTELSDLYKQPAKDKVSAFAGDASKLELPDRFVREVVCAVPMAEDRLVVMEYSLGLPEAAAQLRHKLDVLAAAIGEVHNSGRMGKLLVDVILPLGNAANRQAKKAAAAGIKLSSLRSLMQTKDNEGKTFQHFIVKGMSEKAPDLLRLGEDFPHVLRTKADSSLTNLPAMSDGLRYITIGANKAQKLLTDAQARQDGALALKLGPLLAEARGIQGDCQARFTSAKASFEELCRWLGEDPATTSTEQLFKLIAEFVTDFANEVKSQKEKQAAGERAERMKQRQEEDRAKRAAAGFSPLPKQAAGGGSKIAKLDGALLLEGRAHLRRGTRRSIKLGELQPLTPGSLARILAEAEASGGGNGKRGPSPTKGTPGSLMRSPSLRRSMSNRGVQSPLTAASLATPPPPPPHRPPSALGSPHSRTPGIASPPPQQQQQQQLIAASSAAAEGAPSPAVFGDASPPSREEALLGFRESRPQLQRASLRL